MGAGEILAEQLLGRWRTEEATKRPKNSMKKARSNSAWSRSQKKKAQKAAESGIGLERTENEA